MTTFRPGETFLDAGRGRISGRDLVRAQVVAGVITFGIKSRCRSRAARRVEHGRRSLRGTRRRRLRPRRCFRGDTAGGVRHFLRTRFAGYVATSRLNEGRHYLSDVIFGAALGIISGRTVTLSVAKERFALAPMFIPGGAGVQLTWLGQAHRFRWTMFFSQTVR